MKCTKIFDPTSSGSNDSWRTLDWLARDCLDFSFYIGLTQQEVLEMLSQVHRNMKTFRCATKRGSMNSRTGQWTGSKNRPMLQWSDGRVITAKELVERFGFQVIELDFTDTYYSTGKLEDSLHAQRDYMGVPLGRRLFRCVAGHPCKDLRGNVKTVKVFLAYYFEVMPAISCGRVVLVR